MGFEINGMPVLDNTYGLVNYTNTFKTLTGQSLLGSGNIQDSGASTLEYNTIGSYTFATNNSSLTSQRATIAATALGSAGYSANYGGYCHAVQSDASGWSSIHYCSGTWALKCLISNPNSGGSGALYQRIS